MIANLETTFEFGDFPTSPVATDVALEADTTEAEALAMIQAAWAQVEAFTGRTFRDTATGKCIVKVSSPLPFQWPRYPFPSELTVEVLSQSTWVSHSETYIAELGLVDLEAFTFYRLTQVGSVTGAVPSATIIQAVTNLALYQLIQSPSRREFKNQSAGDTSFTRENVMGVMYGSGAGALLSGEVRL